MTDIRVDLREDYASVELHSSGYGSVELAMGDMTLLMDDEWLTKLHGEIHEHDPHEDEYHGKFNDFLIWLQDRRVELYRTAHDEEAEILTRLQAQTMYDILNEAYRKAEDKFYG